MTVASWCRAAEARLRLAGYEAARLEAQVLASHVLRESRTWVLAHPDHAFNELAGEGLLQRRESGEPLAYIVGYREFYGRRFEVGPGVLVPRIETETLVQAVLGIGLPPGARVLDVGTGSGCVGITLKLEVPTWSVTLLDLSPEALACAKRNAEALEAKVTPVRGDLLPEGGGRFDAIVSNPPYVGANDELPVEVRRFEPTMALFAGEDGLDFYGRLAREAAGALVPGGRLVTEVGDGQADAVIETFVRGSWGRGGEWADLAGTRRVLAFEPPSGLRVP